MAVEVLDHLDDRGGVEPRQAPVAVGERAVQKVMRSVASGGMRSRCSRLRNLQRAVGNVEADDLLELIFPAAALEELALAAAQVEDALCASLAQRRQNRAEPLLVQADGRSDAASSSLSALSSSVSSSGLSSLTRRAMAARARLRWCFR